VELVATGPDVTSRNSTEKLGLCVLAVLGCAGRILRVFGFRQVWAERNGGETSTLDKTTKLCDVPSQGSIADYYS
jgi:hypothetical protein